jgi:pyruvate/oxaloacetate carboxyltransferase
LKGETDSCAGDVRFTFQSSGDATGLTIGDPLTRTRISREVSMVSHVHLRLHDGFTTVTRVVARLHALGAGVDEMHTRADAMCVHVSTDADARRVGAVLDRLPDTEVVTDVPSPTGCLSSAKVPPPMRTRYVVWSEPSSRGSCAPSPR